MILFLYHQDLLQFILNKSSLGGLTWSLYHLQIHLVDREPKASLALTVCLNVPVYSKERTPHTIESTVETQDTYTDLSIDAIMHRFPHKTRKAVLDELNNDSLKTASTAILSK